MAEQPTRSPRPAATRPPGVEARATRAAGGAMLGALVAEVIGTFVLVFVGTGTVLATVQLAPEAPLDETAISLAFGLAVLVAVYALGHISGAHINPAVTIALAAVRRFPWSAVPGYVVAQLVGAVLASLGTWLLFGEDAREELLLGATAPGDRGSGIALVAELVITFLLVVTVMAVAVDDRSPGPAVSGLAIGLVVAAMIFVALPVSGGSLNPARSLGPMIVAADFPGWWVYIVGPIVGGAAGAAAWEFLLRRGQPPGAGRQ
jgi:MIP family channel proteins